MLDMEEMLSKSKFAQINLIKRTVLGSVIDKYRTRISWKLKGLNSFQELALIFSWRVGLNFQGGGLNPFQELALIFSWP